MRAPAFWWRPGGGKLLSPLGAVYGAVTASRMRRRGCGVGIPVICLGNLTAGGGGKTPAALAVARLLAAGGERPVFLTRGYGGRLSGPLCVDPLIHSAVDVGDEPLLLARLAPTIVARDRLQGAQAARRTAATAIVMDDGFQNPTVVKDLAILLVDGRRGIGNGRIIPAGPLRAPLDVQIAHAQALVMVGPNLDGSVIEKGLLAIARAHGLAIFHGRLAPDTSAVAALRGRKVLAFAGIADPAKFFATAAEAGIAVAERVSFPDHHRYKAAQARALTTRADAAGLQLLTTEKDLARLRGDSSLAALAARAIALPVQLVLEEAVGFRSMILEAVRRC
jgi:tetraacyldisaccharide 4'-kinase